MAAHCEACGGHVMAYGTYAFWMKRSARCAECGADVRLRHFWTVVGLGVGLLAAAVGLLATLPTPAGSLTVVLALSGALLVLDWVSYHVLTWEVDPELDFDDDRPILLAPPPEG